MTTLAINGYGNLTTIPDIPNCYLCWPVRGTITQAFGVGSVTGFKHRGIDQSIGTGTPVVAADRGTVNYIYTGGRDMPGLASDGSPGGYGNQVRISHGWGESRYAHFSRVDVRVGQAVSPGTVLGVSGTTGISTGPHLHWEGRTPYGWAFNPLGYIRSAPQPVPPKPIPPPEDELAELNTSQQKELAKLVKLDVKNGNRVPNLLALAATAQQGSFTAAQDTQAEDDPEDRAIRRLGKFLVMAQYTDEQLKALPDGPAKDLMLDLINVKL